MSGKVHLVSLGCAKNLVDSERLLASAMANLGFKPTVEAEEADLILVNTCAFLQSAVSEALEALMELGARKKQGALMAALGCLPARYEGEEAADLAKGLPEVDLWVRPADYPHFEEKLRVALSLAAKKDAPAFDVDCLPSGGRVQGTPFFRAFLKIAEGCGNRCAYCMIPVLRGPLVSYPQEALEREAAALAAGGVRELTLVAQDLTSYGRDRGGKGELAALARKLAAIEGLDWLRLLYAYPERLNERLVKELAEIPKVLPYLDLPFQHASADILKRMGRPPVSPLKLVENLRRWWPGVALRTTLIVGFPGETEENFKELMNFVNQAAFDHLGVFKFSPEEGTRAAVMEGQVPQSIKEKRRKAVMSTQRKISLLRNKDRVGQLVPVLVEGPVGDNPLVAAGRAPFQAPEVDGLVYFDGEQPEAGEIVMTRLIKTSAYDLVGRMEGGAV